MQAARMSPQRGSCCSIIPRTEQDNVPAAQSVFPIKFCKPCGGFLRHKIRAQAGAAVAQRTADDLFYLAFVQVNTGPKHAAILIDTGAEAKPVRIRACRARCKDYNHPMRVLILASLAFLAFFTTRAADLQPLVSSLMQSEQELSGVPFADVVRAATGKEVIPINRTNSVERELLMKIGKAMDEVLRKLNAAESPANSRQRINEVSVLFENAMKESLNAVEGVACDYPKLASGTRQRTGYPDLRLVDKKSGRIVYLDPKLFARGSRTSSLRTFYYEPKRETNKILDDAHHLIVGVEHDGKEGDAWKFLTWELIDLSTFRVRLKAEFQGSNRDLYRPDAVVGRSGEMHE